MESAALTFWGPITMRAATYTSWKHTRTSICSLSRSALRKRHPAGLTRPPVRISSTPRVHRLPLRRPGTERTLGRLSGLDSDLALFPNISLLRSWANRFKEVVVDLYSFEKLLDKRI